ncbi:MAG: hypothetical protein H7Y36_08345 [Armatimonadetes bacterium]|nr:hypothetical protein [Akkermansiaceae bacterium]
MTTKHGLLLCLLSVPAIAGNIAPANRYAYDANAGWIDFSPTPATGVTVGNYFLKGYAYAANYGWINLGIGPANKLAYTSTGTDQGVNVIPATGALAGYAYAANTGWIHFGWAGNNDPNRARINLITGVFSGFAYSANTGWISLSTLKSTSLAITDSDTDGIDDAWEIANFNNLTAAGIGTDFDKDGQTDAAENAAGTLPKNAASWLRITSNSVNSGRTVSTITFTSTPTRLYQLQCSLTLNNDWVTAPTNLAGPAEFPGGAGATTTVTSTHPTGALRFFRVSARNY